MNKSFNLLFLIKIAKAITTGEVPIYLRITIDGKRVEMAAKRYVMPERWNSAAQKVNGSGEDTKSLNAYLKTLERDVYQAQHELLKDNKVVTTETLKAKLIGEEEKQRTLVSIFQEHNKKVDALIDKQFSLSTSKRYATSLAHVIKFLNWKYKVSDIDIRKVDLAFITDFEFYLRSVHNCNNNSAVKYVRNLGKIINLAVANEWLLRSPFVNYKTKVKEVERVFLTEEEIQTMASKELKIERIAQVRDIFLFCCYTGLAYIDVKQLTPSHLSVGIDGEKWIFQHRQKTDTPSNIPLLPMALDILKKYQNHPQCKNENRILPVLSNQKMNSYLKEVADLCGIDKEITFHIARHTFATTVTLTNGVPIESVSKMLGHKNLRTTQHYAKILDRKVSDDMKILRQKFLSPTLHAKTGT